MALTGGLPDWDRPEALAGLRAAFGPALAIENDVDAAALAERALGVGQEADSFAFVHVGSGVGMGLVLDGRVLHRGVHGVRRRDRLHAARPRPAGLDGHRDRGRVRCRRRPRDRRP